MSNGKSKVESHHEMAGAPYVRSECVWAAAARSAAMTLVSFDTDVCLMVDNMQRIVDIVARLCFVNATGGWLVYIYEPGAR